MTEDESTSIDLSVNADEALQVFEQLSAAARDADAQIQQLKQHLATQVTTAFGAQGQQPQTYPQASAVLSHMDPAEVAQAAPEIAQTRSALAERSAEIQARAMDFAGTTPGLATQPPADVLAQFQQVMAQREQQQQAQRERQAQQQAAGVERPARYGYDTTPSAPQRQAMSAPITAATAAMQATAPPMAPVGALATTGDGLLARALTTHGQPGAPVDGQPAAATDAATAAIDPLPQTFHDLAAAAQEADTDLQRLKRTLTAEFNTAFKEQVGRKPLAYDDAASLARAMPHADLVAEAPGVPLLQEQIAARSARISSQVADFGSQNPQAGGQQIDRLMDELKAFIQQQQASTADVSAPDPVPPALGGLDRGPIRPPSHGMVCCRLRRRRCHPLTRHSRIASRLQSAST